MTIEGDKRLAAEAAVGEVRDGMLVGVGTGSTVAFAIAALARRVADGLRIEAVATSDATAAALFAGGLVVRDFAEIVAVDLTIDGADEVDAAFLAVKGAGGALLREKVVAAAARRMVVIADGRKRVTMIGAAGVPVEVLPFAKAFVATRMAALGADVTLRRAGNAAYETDNGNHILDCRFVAIDDPRTLAAAIAAIPGALAHGLFLDEIDAVYFADGGIVTQLERDRPTR